MDLEWRKEQRSGNNIRRERQRLSGVIRRRRQEGMIQENSNLFNDDNKISLIARRQSTMEEFFLKTSDMNNFHLPHKNKSENLQDKH